MKEAINRVLSEAPRRVAEYQEALAVSAKTHLSDLKGKAQTMQKQARGYLGRQTDFWHGLKHRTFSLVRK